MWAFFMFHFGSLNLSSSTTVLIIPLRLTTTSGAIHSRKVCLWGSMGILAMVYSANYPLDWMRPFFQRCFFIRWKLSSTSVVTSGFLRTICDIENHSIDLQIVAHTVIHNHIYKTLNYIQKSLYSKVGHLVFYHLYQQSDLKICTNSQRAIATEVIKTVFEIQFLSWDIDVRWYSPIIFLGSKSFFNELIRLLVGVIQKTRCLGRLPVFSYPPTAYTIYHKCMKFCVVAFFATRLWFVEVIFVIPLQSHL